MTMTKNNRTFLVVVFFWLSIILSQYINFLRPSITSLLQTAKIFLPQKSRNGEFQTKNTPHLPIT